MASHTQDLLAELGQLQAFRDQGIKPPRTRMAGSLSGLDGWEDLLDKALTYGPKVLDLGSKVVDKVSGSSSGVGYPGGMPSFITDGMKRRVPADLTSTYRPPPPSPSSVPERISSFLATSSTPVLIGSGILAFLVIKKILL